MLPLIRLYPSKALFNITEPDASLLSLTDVAHSLSLINRFTGHIAFPYSVGQHSWLMYQEATRRGYSDTVRRKVLFHDAPEMITNDLSRPLKHGIPEMERVILRIEAPLDACFNERFKLESYHLPEVKLLDDILLNTEMRDVQQIEVDASLETLPDTIHEMHWKTVKGLFLVAAHALGVE